MDYVKITIDVKPVQQWFLDVFIARLGEIGFESFEETETGFEAFIPEKEFIETRLKQLISQQISEVEISWLKEVVKDRNWNEEWEKNYFQPLMIGEECVIRAPFHKNYPKAKYEIIIEPNMAFGTGNHETTSLMVEAILAEDFTRKTVLDMGCGTGILGILASMKGAKKVTAVDISEWAVSGTEENAELNNIKTISVKLGDASALGEEKYDFIFANIQKNVLIEDMAEYSRCLTERGKLFLSGFYLKDFRDIQEEAEKQGFSYKNHQVLRNWVIAVFQG